MISNFIDKIQEIILDVKYEVSVIEKFEEYDDYEDVGIGGVEIEEVPAKDKYGNIIGDNDADFSIDGIYYKFVERKWNNNA